MFETKGAMCFPRERKYLWPILGFSNSKLVDIFLSATSPTLDFHEGPVGNLPLRTVDAAANSVELLVQLSKNDWDAFEHSWDFQSLPILTASSELSKIEVSYNAWIAQNRETIEEMKRLEVDNNQLFIEAYGLTDEFVADVPIELITLTVNPSYRCGGKLTEVAQRARFRQNTIEEVISYGIGCMMGRYSLDEPGLIYARAGNIGFDSSRYVTFPADADGIVPITDELWFTDDACCRIRELPTTTRWRRLWRMN
jgi:hypothetical protein